MSKKLVLWDLDGTLCKHNDIFHIEAPIAIAKASISLGASDDVAMLIKENYPYQRTAIRAVSKIFDIDMDDIFQEYYKYLSDDFLEEDVELIEAFKNNQDRFEYGVITNAPYSWAEKSLTKLGIFRFFNKELIFGFDNLGNRFKTDAFSDILLICDKYGYEAKDIVVIDDKSRVLDRITDDVCKVLASNSTLDFFHNTQYK